MSTITNKAQIDQLIASSGYYEDDPRVALIVEYTSGYSGATVWGVTWVHESRERQLRYLVDSDFVRAPRVIWSAAKGGAQ